MPRPSKLTVAAALVILASVASAASGAEERRSHLDLRREAEAAYRRKDYAAALAGITEALQLRPDSPRNLHTLAALSALSGDTEAALAALHRIAAFGVATNIERDPSLASLQGTPAFLRLIEQFAANREPRGSASVLASLPGRTGIIEGIAAHPRSGDIFLGDVHHRCVWRVSRDGQVTRFTAEAEELFGVFGLAVDPVRNVLWAAMTALPEMEGYEPEMKGHAALAEFDLNTSEIRRIVPVPADGRDHGLGDLTLGPNGTVYATDSKAPVVWQLAPDADEFQKAVDSPVFSSLQGVIVDRGRLIVADYSHGLMCVELATGNITALTPPENTTLLGLDGIAAIPGGLMATQNGTTPQRVLRIVLSPGLDRITEVHVLAAGLPQMTDLTLITVADGRPTFVAGAGWDIFDATKVRQPPAHAVTVFQVELQ